jgi:hypothetical protein
MLTMTCRPCSSLSPTPHAGSPHGAFRPLYSPGPDAYSPHQNACVSRSQPCTPRSQGPGFTFGGRHLSPLFTPQVGAVSPGPAYKPTALSIPQTQPACTAFGKADVMARYSCHSGKFSNDAHWTPPAKYSPVCSTLSLSDSAKIVYTTN